MEEDSMALEKPEVVEEKSEGQAALLRSKKALRAFHEKCMDFSRENNVTYLSQDNLTELLGGPSNVKTTFVTELINIMITHNMLHFFDRGDGRGLYKPIAENKGVDLSSMNRDERMIYTRIQQAGNSGIWSHTLARQLNIPNTVFQKCIKTLESKRYIKRVKSVKHSLRVILMLYNLEPADDLTGGPWYNEHELDEAFVSALLTVVEDYVHRRSFPPPGKVEDADGNIIRRVPRFYQPNYRGYATAEDVYEHIMDSGIIQGEGLKEAFGVSHIHKLLEVLCYNKQIQKRTDGVTYRSILTEDDLYQGKVKDEYYDNEKFLPENAEALFGHKGYTEAPCGRCPVFKICGDPGEDVSVATCKYWDEWTGKITSVDYF